MGTGNAILLIKIILKTTFPMRHTFYEWVVMPMGLKNSPTIFMLTMNSLFSNMLDSGMAVFLDDILVYSYMVQGYFTLLKRELAC